jgi:tRNA-2-methylthio-N6-dimethylallyladenosine synthase
MGDTAEIADFALLIEYVAEIPGIERIRYTTSHPNEFTPAPDRGLRQGAAAGEPPAPAGAARQRPHPDGDEARLHRHGIQEHGAQAARHPPRPALSSDFIVGFPGETDDDFAKMMKLIDDVGYDNSFSFIFSPRPGTPAAAARRHAARSEAARLQHLQAVLDGNVQAHQRQPRRHGAAHPGRRRLAQGREPS